MKKFLSILMAIMMVAMLGITAFAAKLTINDTDGVAGETYDAYKIFDASIVTDDSGKITAVAYTISSSSPFKDAIAGFKNSDTDTKAFFTLTPSADNADILVVTWDKDATLDVIKFADTLNSVVTTKSITPTATATSVEATGEGATGVTAKFENLAPGYYFVVSSVGSKLIVDTLDDATANEKNAYPSLTKTADKSTAAIGDTVTYTITVIVPATVDKNITVHDVIEDGLTIDKTSFNVTVDGVKLTSTDYEIANAGDEAENTCDFHVTLKPTSAVIGKTVVITYTAELNGNAEIYQETNDNNAWLTYSAFTSTKSPVKVTTYKADITKVIKGTQTVLDGAQFRLYDALTGGNEIKLVAVMKEVTIDDKLTEVVDYYRPVVAADAKTSEFTGDIILAGTATIIGLDAETYYLEEIKAPEGYNKLTSRQAIEIKRTETNENGTITTIDNREVTVENSTGSELPSTGGIGTTIFYVVGGILMAGAVVLLVTKKKMSVK